MQKLTRIGTNSSGWQRPTGDAAKSESSNSYNQKFGFGHEDWLFRNEWLIDGWRYAFIQGVGKSHAKLVKSGRPFDLTLFEIDAEKRRRYVAAIADVECLDEQQAEDAVREFKRRGWYKTMQAEIKGANGQPKALEQTDFAPHILNVRFRLQNVSEFPAATYAAADDPIQRLARYMLYDAENIGPSAHNTAKQGRAGSKEPPESVSYTRRAVGAVECTPEHARMQAKLMKELKTEFPRARVVREENFIDVTVETSSELLLFEIKSDLSPRSVIRQALGQLLEYAFHPDRKHHLPVRLVIVGRRVLSSVDAQYFDRLTRDFSLPLAYRVVPL
jgi:hypothetical protein